MRYTRIAQNALLRSFHIVGCWIKTQVDENRVIGWAGSLCDPRLVAERNRQKNAPHHVVRLEVFLRTIGMGIVAADTRLGGRLVCVDGLKDAGATVGGHHCIRPVRVQEDFGETRPFEIGAGPVLGIDRPIADQPVLQPASPRCDEAPRFQQILSREREPRRLAPIFCREGDAAHLHPLNDIGGVKRALRLDDTMQILGHQSSLDAGSLADLFAGNGRAPLPQQAHRARAEDQSEPEASADHDVPPFLRTQPVMHSVENLTPVDQAKRGFLGHCRWTLQFTWPMGPLNH